MDSTFKNLVKAVTRTYFETNAIILAVLFLLLALNVQAQNRQSYNLGFERGKPVQPLPKGWVKWGKYEVTITTEAHTGRQAGKIVSNEEVNTLGCIAYQIPANYEGDSITLEGFMKTKDVHDGFAGLLLRINGEEKLLGFDNMEEQAVTGTNDWKKYSITLQYPKEAVFIYAAGILLGKGEAWFDDFVVKIDGKDIQTLTPLDNKLYPAQLDRAFHNKGSSVEIEEWTDKTLEQLEVLGKVWGFLKYYHPAIAKGQYNWDNELFRLLPDYLAIEDVEKRDKLLIKWIKSLGPLKKQSIQVTPEEKVFLAPDLEWINQQNKGLKNALLKVYERRNQGAHYYIGMHPNNFNPVFQHERAYPRQTYPDDGLRVLSLFRYWNLVHYFFPYRYLMDKDWDNALKEYLPLFLAAKDELEYELAALQLIADVQDTHANLWGGKDKVEEWKGAYYPPVHTRFIEDQLVVTDYYNKEKQATVGLAIGDVITTINGQSVADLVQEKTPYYPASNVPTRLRDLGANLLRSSSRSITIQYHSADQKEQTKVLPLFPKDSLHHYSWYRRDRLKSYQLLEGNIGYVTLASIRPEDVPIIKKTFKNTKGIILDIRNYPSTAVVSSLGSFFVSQSIRFVKFTGGNITHPGEFSWVEIDVVPRRGSTYQGKLIVLVNELSQSHAEYTAMAFRAGDKTTIVGSTTAGADGDMSFLYLPGGLWTGISGIGVYYPDGKETQRVGIVPDVLVTPTIEGIRAGRDELIERARWLIEQ